MYYTAYYNPQAGLHDDCCMGGIRTVYVGTVYQKGWRGESRKPLSWINNINEYQLTTIHLISPGLINVNAKDQDILVCKSI
jgi:hypothetical protein